LIPFLKKRLALAESPKGDDGLPESLNDRIVALRGAFLDSMAVTSAAEALDQFSYSARIVSDLKRVRYNEGIADSATGGLNAFSRPSISISGTCTSLCGSIPTYQSMESFAVSSTKVT
jgi:hypothetical protein